MEKLEVKSVYSLSPMQEGMLFHTLLNPTSPAYFEQFQCTLLGELNVRLLEQSFNILIEKYDILRTNFMHLNLKSPKQIVFKKRELIIKYEDLSNNGMDITEADAFIEQYAVEDKRNGFDLAKDMLIRLAVFRVGEDRFKIVWSYHHILMDGWCLKLLLQQWLEYYNVLLNSQPLHISKVRPYADYIRWLEQQDRDEAKQFWLKYLEGYSTQAILPSLSMGVNGQENKQEYVQVDHFFQIDEDVRFRLESIAKKQQVTLNTVLQSAWAIMLGKYNRTNDVVIGTVTSGRPAAVDGVEEMIGLFINTIPVRIKWDNYDRFDEMLQQVQRSGVEAQNYDYYPLADIQSNSELKQTLLHHLYGFQNYPFKHNPQDEPETYTFTIEEEQDFEQSNYDFNVIVSASEGLEVNFKYNATCYDAYMVQNIEHHFKHILHQISHQPGICIGAICLITDIERTLLLEQFNETTVSYDLDGTFLKRFEAQVQVCPDDIAVVYRDQELSYKQLNERANQLAYWLKEQGITHQQVIGLMLEPCTEMVVGMLAIAKVGGVFLPIDHSYPIERIQYMLEDSAAALLLSNQSCLRKGPWAAWVVRYAAIEDIQLDLFEHSNLNHHVQPTDLAYLIYTSGSTGKPKGVMIEHRSLLNFALWYVEYYKFSKHDKCAKYIGFGFDPSVSEMVPPLLAGSSIVIIPEEIRLELDALNQFMEAKGVTIAAFPAAITEQFIKLGNRTLTRLITGGDKLKHFESCSFQIYNNYGPTENTITSTVFPVSSLLHNIPIGKPISNGRVYIADDDGCLLPVGVPGELYVAGTGLARGYWNRPDLTESSFIPDPYVSGERMYRTGDLCRWLPDGNIEFLGRIDNQVKIRGYRVELGEIEWHLFQQPEIKEAAVTILERVNGEKILVGYMVAEEAVTSTEMKRRLAKILPDYMVPTYLIFLDKMPLTSNGKIDRQSLPYPKEADIESEEHANPTNEIEAKLISIWKNILGVEYVGVNSHFFALGGNSLSAIRLVSAIKKELQFGLPLQDIFQQPLLSDMARMITGTDNRYAAIEPAAPAAYYPVSPAQRRIFIIEQLEGVGYAYHMPVIVRLRGNLDKERWRKAILHLVQRHDSLRTTFAWVNGEPMQQVGHVKQEAVDVRELFGGEADLETAVEDFMQPFDLYHGPLFRTRLLHISAEEHLMLVDMHHIIADGTSIGVLVEEFSQLYREEVLPNLRIQYQDYAVWQQEQAQNGQFDKQEQYWLSQFEKEIPVLTLPLDQPRPQMQSFEGDILVLYLDTELRERIHKLAADTGTTLYMVMLAAYTILLSKYSGQEDIVVGTPTAGRPHADLEQMVGMFVNTLALRSYPIGTVTFLDYVQVTKQRILEAFEHQEYPYEQLVDKLNIQRDFSRNPLFDTMFAVENMSLGELQAEGLTLEPYTTPRTIAKFDLTFTITENSQGIELDIEYATALFNRATIERMAKHYVRVLEIVMEHPSTLLSQVNLLVEDERTQILQLFNDTWTEYPREKTIHALFEEQVASAPDRFAITFEEERLTYRELNERADRLANALQARGTMRDQAVAIIGDRSLAIIIGMLAVLKAGGAYVPIDPDYPLDRIEYVLHDSQCELVLVQGAYADRLPGDAAMLVLEDESSWSKASAEQVNKMVAREVNVTDLAYVMYTSGSTGRPKGVMIEHRNVVRLVKNNQYMSFAEGERILQTGAPVFDATTFEIWGALLNGLELYVVDKYTILNPQKLGEAIRNYDITTMWLTAALFGQLAQERTDLFEPLTYLLVGGDALPAKQIQAVRDRCPNLVIINGYGPTENTTFSHTYVIKNNVESNIPIGRPISNSTAYIVDKYGELLPIGVPGELWVGGDGVGRGYWNNDELTAGKFVPSPWVQGERIYKTGDRAKWLPDGNVQFLGRLDYQVKIRGFRVETGEIEVQIAQHKAVSEVVVTVVTEEDESKSLCAYVVTDMGTEELRTYLKEQIPEYMIPSYIIRMDRLPLTPNGKVDRRSLPQPESQPIRGRGNVYIPPLTDIEIRLSNIWKDILKVNEVGRNDHFFQLGGHSLKAAILLARISKELHADFPLKEIFKSPILSDMAQLTSRYDSNYCEINPASPAVYYPVSYAQRRIFIIEQLEGVGHAYHMPVIVRLWGNVDKERWIKTILHLVQRHDSLRTTFAWVNGEPMQQVGLVRQEAVDVKELLGGESTLEQEVEGFMQPFDLYNGPLFRARLLHISNEEHLMLVDMHHIIADGTSIGVLVEEFSRLYGEETLPDLRIQYQDYAVWQQEQAQNGRLDKQEQYWLCQFGGELPVLSLPLDHPRPQMQSFEGDTLVLYLDTDLRERIHKLAADTGTTLYMVMLAAYTVLLAKYSGQEDIVVGTPTAGRPHADLEQMVGMFVNTLAVRNCPKGTLTFLDYVQATKECVLEAFEHQEYPYEQLVDKLNIQRDFSRNPLFDTMFAVENMSLGELQAEGLILEPYTTPRTIAKFDLTFTITENSQGIELDIEYATALFNRTTIEQMANRFVQILETVMEHPNILLSQISVLTEVERTQILESFNDTWTAYPRERTIHALFEEQVTSTPDRIALTFEQDRLTYKELNERADRLAHALRAQGVKRNQAVAIIGDRSIAIIVGMLAVLKAGSAYVPIDPDYPSDRIEYVLHDSQCQLVLVQAAYADKVPGDVAMLVLEDETSWSKASTEQVNEMAAREDNVTDLAYVMYTSGSTGRPKGVMIEHRNVVRLVKNNQYMPFAEGERILQTGAPVFDATTFEIWGALLNGLELYVVDKYTILNPHKLGEAIQNYSITTMWLTAALFGQLAQERTDLFEPLTYLLIGGDALPTKQVQAVRDRCPNLVMINGYGPTENTTFSLTYFIEDNIETNIPIGKPISNSTAYIVDAHGQLLPIGIPGELWVGGDGVGRGYWNNVDLTAEKFVPNPWVQGERIYKTGDRAKWLPDGNVQFLGRLDYQVKIRGFRVETGEIEGQIIQHIGVSEVVVTIVTEDDESKSLCAYVVAEMSEEELRAYLKEHLPEYMIPSYIVLLDRLPLTTNGKVDRKSLPAPEQKISTTEEIIKPRNDIEKQIVELWQDVLNVKPISVYNNFFSIGGHSLNAIEVIARLSKQGWNLSIQQLFSNPTPASLAEWMTNHNETSYSLDMKFEPIEYRTISSQEITDLMASIEVMQEEFVSELLAGEVEEVYPISPTQFYHLDVHDVSGTIFTLEQPVDRSVLEDAITHLISRQDVLRSILDKRNDGGWKLLTMPDQLRIPYVDLSNYDRSSQDLIMQKLLHDWFLRSYTASDTLMYRLLVLKMDSHRHTIILPCSHAIFDYMSSEVIKSSLIEYCNSLGKGWDLPAYTGSTYRNFVNQIRLGPIEMDDEEIMQRFALEKFHSAAIDSLQLFNRFAATDSTSITFKTECVYDGVEGNWRQALEMFITFFNVNFGLRHIPMWLTHYGRQYNKSNYYHVVGECIDYIPVVLEVEANIIEQFNNIHRLVALANDTSLNMANLMYNPAATELWSRSTQHIREAFACMPINFNYLGEQDSSQDYFKDAEINKVNTEGRQRILFTSWHDKGHLYVNVALPFTENADRLIQCLLQSHEIILT
ncbi:non-ribosomal peptide synthetase [Paenibacillus arenosi]|uniref:Amino acid adenylation domain-containing protein n=1 Tax=Paenibacillus arenosi TaxID=2774142 RepID=A0ABR9B0E5_9BACL|nr:non-ribosomal peptide synthetase [Paenibacillus arenosi]MBD8499799.1 amino acid adenylation domain-containing protein [Paenibacillus arenosi]